MKLLITSRADDNIKDQTDITFPVIQEAADRWGADFIRLDHVSDCDVGDGRWHYRIMKHWDLFGGYERILHLDADVLLNKNCPNLFETVPSNMIGTAFEDVGSRRNKRIKLMADIQDEFGEVGWNQGYINTGVFITSKMHRSIFEKINGSYWQGIGWDDVHLGYQIARNKFEVYELPFQFNHMTMFSEPWNDSADRFQSHIIHYAGGGIFEKGKYKKKTQQMLADKTAIYESSE